MITARLARWRRAIETPFPERHIYIRSSAGESHGLVLTTGQQLAMVGAACGLVVWAAVTTLGMTIAAVSANVSHQQAQTVKATYARQLASHDARLIAAVDTMAQRRAETLKATLRLAGVNPDTVARTAAPAEGGPLIDVNDPRAIAAMLDVNKQSAEHIQRTVKDISDMRVLASASSALPLGRPTADPGQSSGFGVRTDPFTGHAAFHSGLDFPAPARTPVFATAPGVVTFTGAKPGYGSTIEINHGQGVVTRFAHLSSISVKVGQAVGDHQRIGEIGSTGRSTGPHLHYEVWRDGRPQDPERFLKAGDYVHQAG